MSASKFFEIDNALMIELYKDLDKCFLKYGITEVERVWISTMYAIEKQSYLTIQMTERYYQYQIDAFENKGV